MVSALIVGLQYSAHSFFQEGGCPIRGWQDDELRRRRGTSRFSFPHFLMEGNYWLLLKAGYRSWIMALLVHYEGPNDFTRPKLLDLSVFSPVY